jgi:hypothetical protein
MSGELDGTFKIFDKYKLHEHADKLMTEKYGLWDPNEGMTVYEENIWKRRSNLKGRHFRYSGFKYILFQQ